jgi:hypothetical protein
MPEYLIDDRLVRVPVVASPESCVACFRGDCVTGVLVHGSAEFAIAGLIAWAGLTQTEVTP